MSIRTLGYPADLRDRLRYKLPDCPMVRVEPKDSDHRRCAAWAADHYEVAAYYAESGPSQLYDALEEALGELPETYLTTQLKGNFPEPGTTIRDAGWPVRYRDNMLRVQVRALMRDPGAGAS